MLLLLNKAALNFVYLAKFVRFTEIYPMCPDTDSMSPLVKLSQFKLKFSQTSVPIWNGLVHRKPFATDKI